MRNLFLLALAGLVAQLVDGSLGMAFGVTSSTLLLTIGIAPALVSFTTHLAEIGTTAASGVAHWRFGNVDWSKILWMAVPGGVAAFFGAVALSSLSAEAAAPVVAIILFGLGAYILIRFAFVSSANIVSNKKIPKAFLMPLGGVAGFVDALGGGGWGPIGTSSLLSSGRMEPRKVVGTIDTSEFIVTICASAGFIVGLGAAQIPFGIVGALLVGGIIAAPIAAWIVKHLNARLLGTAVGGFILLTNAQNFLSAIGFGDSLGISIPVYTLILIVWIVGLYLAISAARSENKKIFERSGSEGPAEGSTEGSYSA